MKKNYFIFSSGSLTRKDNTIEFTNEAGIKKIIPIQSIDSIYLMGTTTLNTMFLGIINSYSICIHFYGYYGNYIGSFTPSEKFLSGKLLIEQVRTYENLDRRMVLSRETIFAASKNILKNLQYYNRRKGGLDEYINNIEHLQNQISKTSYIEELMGIEGNIRKIYYNAWELIIPREVDFTKRVKRPPDNLVNAMISFINTLLYAKILSEINKTQLNSSIGFLHAVGVKKHSLALDVSEIFKPFLVDRLIFTLLNKKMITEKDADVNLDYVYLSEDARKLIVQKFDEYLSTVIRHSTLNKDTSYQTLIRYELYKLIKFHLEDKEYKGLVMDW